MLSSGSALRTTNLSCGASRRRTSIPTSQSDSGDSGVSMARRATLMCKKRARSYRHRCRR